MNKLVLAAVMVISAFVSLDAYARGLSDVDRDGSWYKLYDENGKLYKTISASSVGDVKGWSDSMIVSQHGSWVYIFDTNMKKLKTMSASSTGEVISVSGDRFTTRHGNWIYTYDRNGKRLNTRYSKK